MENSEEEKKQQPSKEEILEQSRNENKHRDEMEKSNMRKASRIGLFIGTLVACVVVLISTVFTKGEAPLEMFIVLFSIYTGYTLSLAYGGHKHKKVLTVCGIVMAVCVATLFVLWILELCGKLV